MWLVANRCQPEADAGHRGKKEDQIRVRFIRLNRFPEVGVLVQYVVRFIRLNRFPEFAVLVQYTSSTPTDAGQREKNRSQSRTVEPGLMFAIVTFVRTDVTPPGAVLCGTWFLQQRANYCCDVRICVNVVVYS